MCLILNKKRKIKKDIFAYKVMAKYDNGYGSPLNYQHLRYQLGSELVSNRTKENISDYKDGRSWRIMEGIHVLLSLTEAQEYMDKLRWYYLHNPLIKELKILKIACLAKHFVGAGNSQWSSDYKPKSAVYTKVFLLEEIQ